MKNKPLWILVALIANIPFLIGFIISAIMGDFLSHIFAAPFLPGLFFATIFRTPCPAFKDIVNFQPCPYFVLVMLLTSFIVYFIVGALIGFLIQKIKSKK